MILEDCIEKNPNRKTRYDLIAFVIQMEETSEVRPNTATHPEFGIALEEAKDAGVEPFIVRGLEVSSCSSG